MAVDDLVDDCTGLRYLEHSSGRTSLRQLYLRFGTAPAEIGALPS